LRVRQLFAFFMHHSPQNLISLPSASGSGILSMTAKRPKARHAL
jgi:hypothetical protein